ncbi:unnamed protein product [Lampetra planeri]
MSWARGGGRVPVLDVHAGNAAACWESARRAVRAASFIAMDAEMSGLGNRKALLAQSIEERYIAIRNAARTRSLLSIGLACFRLLPGKVGFRYEVQVLNLTLLSTEEYTVEPQSLKFLVEHGFDFNKQYTQGLPYRPGSDMTASDSTAPGARALFSEVVLAERPLVLHNGLLDLAFLFQALHTTLPPTLQTFMADLATLLPAGIYDTKHIVETETDMAASFLEYAFRKCTRGGVKSGVVGSGVHVQFGDVPPSLLDHVDERLCPEPRAGPEKSEEAMQTEPAICERFAGYGWCSLGVKCPLSHDMERILDDHERLVQTKRQRRSRSRKKSRAKSETDGSPSSQPGVLVDDPANIAEVQAVRDNQTVAKRETDLGDDLVSKRPRMSEEHLETVELEERVSSPLDVPLKIEAPAKISNDDDGGEPGDGKESEIKLMNSAVAVASGSHRAGFDAFMTGFVFASVLAFQNGGSSQCGGDVGEQIVPDVTESWLPSCRNKLYLSGKAMPLHVYKSAYSNSSRAHRDKMTRLGKHIE